MPHTTTRDTILVLSGTGKTGRRITDRLHGQGRRVRIGSRSGLPVFDWNTPSTWEAVLGTRPEKG